MQGDFKRIAPLEVAIEILFTIEMHQQPAIPLIRHEDGIPGFLITYVKQLVTDEAAPHVCRNSPLEPLVDECMKIIQSHHIETGIRITKENRVGAFAKIVLSAAQGDYAFQVYSGYHCITSDEGRQSFRKGGIRRMVPYILVICSGTSHVFVASSCRNTRVFPSSCTSFGMRVGTCCVVVDSRASFTL